MSDKKIVVSRAFYKQTICRLATIGI